MIRGSADGPAWVGIGAQRSGTTWFADLLVQHPDMSFGRSGRKELHGLNASLVGDPVKIRAKYLAEFRGAHGAPGEFTPAYLRMLWVPDFARTVWQPDVVLVVILRDPVERFASAMRLLLERHRPRRSAMLPEWARDRGSDATWAGMYATHLAAWAQVFAPEQLIVLQYERLKQDPQTEAARVWTALGLSTHELQGVDARSPTSVPDSQWSFDEVAKLRERLIEAYRPEVDRLESEWGIDLALWRNFS